MVNDRQNLALTTFGRALDGTPVEWRIAPSPVPYLEAVAAMETRAAAIAAHEASELVWLLEHPPLYTSGTSGKTGDLLDQGKAGIEQVAGFAAGAGRIERRVFQKPDQFGGLMGGDRRCARLHGRDGLKIRYWRWRDSPFDGRAVERAAKGRQSEVLAIVNHWLTITWSS